MARTLSSIGVLIGALEAMAASRNYAADGIFAEHVFRVRNMIFVPAGATDRFHAVLSARGIVLVNALKAVAACVLLAPSLPDVVYACACLSVLVVHCVTSARASVGLDGSDQMLVIVMSGLLLFYVQPEGFAGIAGLCFIAAQALLAYAAAGISKLASATWRDGRALRLIFHTATFGSRSTSRLLDRWPVADRIGCWAVISVECGFIAVVLLPPHLALAVLAVGVAFHAGCAVTMGLNVFFWEFVATYPIVLTCAALGRSFFHAGSY